MPQTTEEKLFPPDMTDDQVADVLMEEIPAAIRIAVGQPLRALFKMAILRERGRCCLLADRAARHHQAEAMRIDHALPGLTPGTPALGSAIAAQRAHAAMAGAAAGMAVVMRRAPGACARCRGTRLVPGTLAGPDGQPVAVPCPNCPPAAPDASVSELPPGAPAASES